MSSFQCEKCGANIIDTDCGYATGCEHYPVKQPEPSRPPEHKPNYGAYPEYDDEYQKRQR